MASLRPFDTIHVMPGLFCNFQCSHCVNNSGPKVTLKVSEEELADICNNVRKFSPSQLQFTGGEPTFFHQEINQITEAHPDLENCKVLVTSNGWYGKTPELTEKNLGQFCKIDKLLLSFDVFHGNESKVEYIENINHYSKAHNISLTVSFCLSSPLDLLKAKSILAHLDVPVVYQKVDESGRARDNSLGYQYPSFEEDVLDKTCPNLKTMNYIPQKGYTSCCGNLIFNHDKKGIAGLNLDEYLQSPFYKKLQAKTFREMLRDKGMSSNNLPSHLSSACSLCEYIHADEEVLCG